MGETDSTKYRFLLGGYDLEMVVIRQLLEEHGIPFYDRNLAWGARLSAYQDVFNGQDHFVGVELIEDTELPKHYTNIDHHNENSHRSSAIEQVAKLLGIELNCYQQLVAANDKGYIPAMEAIGASKKEIDEIRRADRKAQGVTDEDETLAVKSIESNLIKAGGLLVVESLTPKFSCITDRLFPFKKLLIGFENHFVYYGEDTQRLIETYRQLIEDKKAYYGGINNGFSDWTITALRL